MTETEEEYVPEYEEISLDKLMQWYQEASNSLFDLVGYHLPSFPGKLSEAKSVYNPDLDIHHPYGDVFYPCAGSDDDLFRYFSGVSDRIIISTTNTGNNNIENIGSLNVISPSTSNTPKQMSRILKYQQDAILTFLTEIEHISVFIHRSDSEGEGGSNQWWFGKVLFPAVLSKMSNGGLLVTDGSLCGYYDEIFDRYVSWNALCGMTPYDKPKVGVEFTWSSYRFRCVAGPYFRHEASQDMTMIWQVYNNHDLGST